MPLLDAQVFFNKENQIDKINVLLENPSKTEEIKLKLINLWNFH